MGPCFDSIVGTLGTALLTILFEDSLTCVRHYSDGVASVIRGLPVRTGVFVVACVLLVV